MQSFERELAQLVDLVPSHLWRLDAKGEPIFFNKRMVDFLGVDVVDICGPEKSGLDGLVALVHPEDARTFGGALRQSLQTGEPFASRYRLRGRDGGFRWMSSRAEPLRDDAGDILQWYGLCHDIDDQMRADEALERSELQLRQIVDTVPIAIWSFTSEGRVTYISPQNREHLGLDEITFESFATVSQQVHPDDRPVTLAARQHGIGSAVPFSVRYRRRVGEVYRWTEGRAAPLKAADGTVVQWYAVSLDVDDEVRAQEALRDRERELAQLVDIVPSLLWRLSADGAPVFFSKRMVEFLGLDVGGYDTGDLSGLAAAIAALVHPDDRDTLTATLDRSLASGESFALKYRLRRADGAYRWMQGRAEPLRDASGAIVQWYGIASDIEDQVRAADRLRESEQQLRRLVDALPTQIWAASPAGEPSYLNRRLADYVGLTLNDLDAPDATRLQMAILNSVAPEDAAAVGQGLAQAFTTGEAFAMKYRQRRADGIYRWISGRAEPLRDGNGRIEQWYGVSFDIDDDVRTQEELQQTRERLAVASQAASLAELSASIAHEVNQPLAAIVANSHASQRWLAAEPPNVERAVKGVERVIRDANAAAELVGRVRALFRQGTEGRAPVSLASVIMGARDLMADEAARRNVRMTFDIEPDLQLLTLDRVQLQQVMVNLLRNGIEALQQAAGERLLTVRTRRQDDGVTTEVSDTGPGITAPERIFDPFFTTKSQGMGMGLAICRSIIEAHGGRLRVEANEPHGARLIFTLPLEVPNP